MTWIRPVILVGIVIAAVSTPTAQEQPGLLFEITVDRSLLARPEMRVRSGREGRLELGENHGEVRVTFTPTVRADDISIAFDIADDDRRWTPTLVIRPTVPGALQWTSRSRGQVIRIVVSRVR
jgi:hypothetical protein